MIFAREISDSLTSLVKSLDAATVENTKAKMGSFVVFCNDDEDLKDKLKAAAEKAELKKVVLTIEKPDGPPKYKIAKDADITVIYYNKREVKVNRVFKKGELDDKAVKELVADIAKILPSNKDEKSKSEKPKGDK